MNLKKPKNWDTIDLAKGGYTETDYEFFEYVPSIPLLKAKGKDLWHIGSIYKNTKQLRPERLFSNENEARQAFEGVKKFIKSELDSRRRFKDKPSEFLRDWLKEYGSNPYVGDSIYLQTAREELKLATSREAIELNKSVKTFPESNGVEKSSTDLSPTYAIYQLKPSEHDLLFESYERLQHKGLRPNIAQYDLVYIIDDKLDYSLNEIYEKFNIDRPEDFSGHSLSVSDVIVKSNGNSRKAYYVDSFGFQPLPYFFDSSAANKKDMEM